MVSGLNKVFCGTENGVCELTKDTVYVHPTDKQCSWTPDNNSPFKLISTYTDTTLWLSSSDFTYGCGTYYITWSFTGNIKYYNTLCLGIYAGTLHYNYAAYSSSIVVTPAGNDSGYVMIPISITYWGSSSISATVFNDNMINTGGSSAKYSYESISFGIGYIENSTITVGSIKNSVASLYYLSF